MTRTQTQALVAGGTLLTVIAAVLPWLKPNSTLQQLSSGSSGSQSVSGIGIFTEGVQPLFSGPIAVIIAIGLLVIAVLASGNEWADAAVIVGGGVVALVGALWILAPATIIGGGTAGQLAAALLSPGIGVYLTIVGGALILAGGVVSYVDADVGSDAARPA